MSNHRQPKRRAGRAFRTRKMVTVTSTLAVLAVGGVVTASQAGLLNTVAVSAESAQSQSVEETASAVPSEAPMPTIDVEKAVEEAEKKAKEPLPDLSKMSMGELQAYSVRMQSEFVQASLAYEAAKTQAEQANVAAVEAEDESVQAQAAADEARDQFSQQLVDTYTSGVVSNPVIKVFSGGPDTLDELTEDMATIEQANEAQADNVEEYDELSEHAAALAVEAADLREEAEDAESDAEVLLDDIQGRASKVAAAANEALLDSSDGRTLFASAEQTARNDAALKNWRTYLKVLDRAKIVPPAANKLNAKRLPYGLKPLVGSTGEPVAGVAAKKFKGETVTVLPRETIAAVSRAFAAMGKPYVGGNAGPETYDCSGLTSAVWEPTGYRVPAAQPVEQFQTVRPVAAANAQVGDLVFFKDAADGIQNVGLNLGGDLMLAADATSSQVGVQPFPKDAYGVGRVTLPRGPRNTAPATDVDSVKRCGGSAVPASANGMLYPLKEDAYTFSSTFGEAGPMWSSGFHTGLDFSAPAGTPVFAAKSGTVRIEPTGWAGPNHIIIDHGDGLETAYAHMEQALVKDGDTVRGGEIIGAVGTLGNSSGPHLHFEVLVGGVKVDPMLFLAGEGAGAAGWGGFTNGMIPATSMCPVQGAPGHQLRCDAAAAYNAMAAAYQKANGSPLCITDSYRDYAGQVTLYGTKPSLAAVPGTSNHGWALAVDLCGGIENFGTKQHQWMKDNAPKFGWQHPQWARQGGGREEPWHWEFGNIS